MTAELHAALSRAATLLQLQQTLIEELSAELAVTRVERDEARQIRTLIEALGGLPRLEQPNEIRRRCRCGADFVTSGAYTYLCAACRSAHGRKAAAASHAAAVRRAGQETRTT